ncbi:hypothetical protein MNBD_PLANCTO02-921 [hydrothermal vent metagenome]|uniref:Uncharacterized protein n=1 Tax=hydrothermal vent metagenome TaxID=652676 RepID=A0A3B1DVC7_9ZZZZ
MTKLGFTMTSFVAAIPGAFLCYFLAMFFFQKIDQEVMTILKVLAGFTLFVSFLVAIMPVAILIFFKSAPPEEDVKGQLGSSSGAVEADDIDDVDSFDDGDSLAEDDSFGDDESAELESFESSDEIAEVDGEFDSEESSEFSFEEEDDDDFDFEED